MSLEKVQRERDSGVCMSCRNYTRVSAESGVMSYVYYVESEDGTRVKVGITTLKNFYNRMGIHKRHGFTKTRALYLFPDGKQAAMEKEQLRRWREEGQVFLSDLGIVCDGATETVLDFEPIWKEVLNEY